MKKVKATNKNLILFHDGKQWHARVRRDNGSYKFNSSEKMDDTTIPEELLKWGIENGAKKLRVMLSRELNDFILDDSAPHLMPADELYEVLVNIIADKTSLDSDEIAPNLILEKDLGLASSNRMWGCGLELQNISNYIEACRKEGIDFEGATTIPIAAILENAINSPSRNLIFFGQKDSFVYASTQTELIPEYKYIPMSCPTPISGDDFYRRLLRRLQAYTSKPLKVICPDENLEEAKKLFEDNPNSDIEYYKFSEIRSEIMQVVADAQTYLLDSSAGLVSIAPKKKDAKHTGGIICFSAIILSGLILGALFLGRTYQLDYWTNLKAKVDALAAAQKSAQSEYDTAKSKLDEMRNLIHGINQTPIKITDNFLDILCIISDNIPPTSWISSIKQTKDKKLIITGKTLHLKAQSDFVLSLNEQLSQYKKVAIPRKVLINPKGEENTFEIEIAPQQ